MTRGNGLPAALLSRVHHNLSALSGLMRSPVFRYHRDSLSSCYCNALAACWMSLGVVCTNPSSVVVFFSSI